MIASNVYHMCTNVHVHSLGVVRTAFCSVSALVTAQCGLPTCPHHQHSLQGYWLPLALSEHMMASPVQPTFALHTGKDSTVGHPVNKSLQSAGTAEHELPPLTLCQHKLHLY